MKVVKKLVALAIGILMSTTVLAGCSADGMTLYSALEKSQSVKSAEIQMDMSFNVSAKNMSPQEEQMMAMLLPVINNTKINALTRLSQNEDKTVAKMHSDIKINAGQMPMDMGVWVDTDISSDKPFVKEVFKMPALFNAQLPQQFAGKEYMVMDFSEMANTQGVPQMDYTRLAQFSKEFQPKFMEFFAKYAKQFNPDSVKVTKIADAKRITPYFYGPVDIYKIELNDKTFKELIRYTVNNFAENKEIIPFIKDYMLTVMSIMGLPEQELNDAKQELDKSFADFQTNLPETIKNINSSLDKIENIKILGDNGIVLRYAVNKQGYIISEEGNVEFVVDLPNLIKLNEKAITKEGQPTGIYTVNLKFSSDIRKINMLEEIQMPQTDKDNSFNYFDLLNLITAPIQ